jgi:hypothetical protein
MLALCGCANQTLERIQAEHEQSLREGFAAIEKNYQETLKLLEKTKECNRQLRIGMTAIQVTEIKDCKHLLTNEGRLMGGSKTVTAAGTSQQVRWGNGYLYFQNGVLVLLSQKVAVSAPVESV